MKVLPGAKAFGYRWRYSSETVLRPGFFQVTVCSPVRLPACSSRATEIWYSVTRLLRTTAWGFSGISGPGSALGLTTAGAASAGSSDSSDHEEAGKAYWSTQASANPNRKENTSTAA